MHPADFAQLRPKFDQACQAGDPALLSALLSPSAAAALPLHQRAGLLDAAVESQCLEGARLIVSTPDPILLNPKGRSLLWSALRHTRLAPPQTTPSGQARIDENVVNTLRHLIDMGADPMGFDGQQSSPLTESLLHHGPAVTAALIQRGATPIVDDMIAAVVWHMPDRLEQFLAASNIDAMTLAQLAWRAGQMAPPDCLPLILALNESRLLAKEMSAPMAARGSKTRI